VKRYGVKMAKITNLMTNKTIDLTKLITIKVEGGCVVDVENMPKGYKYIIDDADLREC
jgi:hypothetical protein|tara:strand:- start:45 stop:218 length:174 start_codon:yes stop_codon:yes gene_type:complete